MMTSFCRTRSRRVNVAFKAPSGRPKGKANLDKQVSSSIRSSREESSLPEIRHLILEKLSQTFFDFVESIFFFHGDG